LLRQHFRPIPQDLYVAAAIDGCSPLSHALADCVAADSPSSPPKAAIFSVIGS
jgi:hypothetical protein